jgi:nitrite reductase/ring-hydroxylating ferredoxin subunit
VSTGDNTAEAPPAWHRIGSLAELRGGSPVKASIGKVRVAAFAVGDSVVATNGRCPHAGGPLHEGEVEDGVLTCPWHGWTYDLSTGACGEDDSLNLDRFPVRIEGDDIMVQM